MGTIVNTVAIIIAGLLGLRLKQSMKASFEQAVLQVVGIAVFLIGLLGVLKSMLVIDPVSLQLADQGALMVLLGLVIGVLMGEWWRLDDRIHAFGKHIEQRFQKEGFAAGFINASLIFCIGAMSIIGSINDGVFHDPSVLYVKSAIDFVTCMVLASTLGFGVIFSAISVFVYQGSLTLLARWIDPYASAVLINQICMLGYVMVMCIGMNFLGFVKIKTANLLPALLVPIGWQAIVSAIAWLGIQ